PRVPRDRGAHSGRRRHHPSPRAGRDPPALPGAGDRRGSGALRRAVGHRAGQDPERRHGHLHLHLRDGRGPGFRRGHRPPAAAAELGRRNPGSPRTLPSGWGCRGVGDHRRRRGADQRTGDEPDAVGSTDPCTGPRRRITTRPGRRSQYRHRRIRRAVGTTGQWGRPGPVHRVPTARCIDTAASAAPSVPPGSGVALAPSTAPRGKVVPISTTSSLAVYLVLVVGGAVALVGSLLLRFLAVRLAWTS